MKRRTVEQMEQYVAGFEAAVATTLRLIDEGKSGERLEDALIACRTGVRAALDTEREFNAR